MQKKSDSVALKRTLKRAAGMFPTDPEKANVLLDSAFPATTFMEVDDSIKSEYYMLKGDILFQVNMKDSAYQFMQEAFVGIQAEWEPLSKARTGLWLVNRFSEDGRYLIATKYLDEVIPITTMCALDFEKARAINLAGVIKTAQGDFVGAQNDLLKAAHLFDSIGEVQALGPVYLNIASNYLAMNDPQLALHHNRLAEMVTAKYHDSLNYQKTLNNLGILYRVSHPDSAEYYFRRSWNYTSSAPGSMLSLSARFNLAGLFYDKKQYQKSLELNQEVLGLSRKYNVKSGIYRALSGIGNAYEAMNKDRKAIEAFREGAELAREAGEIPVQINLLGGLVYMYEKAGQLDKAYALSKVQRHLNDSIMGIDKQIAVRNLEILYNTEKSERLNESMKNRLIGMQIKVRNHWVLLITILTFTTVLIILLFRIFHLYRQRNHAYYTLIQKYKTEVEKEGVEKVLGESPVIGIQTGMDEIDPLYQKLLIYFENEKPYLNPDLKFDEVAIQLKISRKLLLQMIKNQTGMNFNGFVNNYRIKEALKLLADPERKNFKIEAIARESGFGSKANFYSVFTLVTGSKPSDYR
jgi:AraC-like DNA-binding protein